MTGAAKVLRDRYTNTTYNMWTANEYVENNGHFSCVHIPGDNLSYQIIKTPVRNKHRWFLPECSRQFFHFIDAFS